VLPLVFSFTKLDSNAREFFLLIKHFVYLSN
jgi:hypothetical protein